MIGYTRSADVVNDTVRCKLGRANAGVFTLGRGKRCSSALMAHRYLVSIRPSVQHRGLGSCTSH